MMIENPLHHSENLAGPWLEITYHCDACNITWICEWSCACDDDCPTCWATIEALRAESVIDNTG